MAEHDGLTESFEAQRPHLRAVAYRMLGSKTEADDAVQEAWLRLDRADTDGVTNLKGWLTTVVARICLDMLRSRKVRLEDPLGADADAPTAHSEKPRDPEQDVLLSDSIGLALLVVLETLAPAERVAFVLHDMFAVPFDEIAPIVGRSPDATRQLASRARQRLQRGPADVPEVDGTRQREVVDAFLAASRAGDFQALLRVLDADVVLRADETAVRMGASSIGLSSEIRGAAAVANVFKGRAQGAKPALIDGLPGVVWVPGGHLRSLFRFTMAGGNIAEIELVADPASMGECNVEVLETP